MHSNNVSQNTNNSFMQTENNSGNNASHNVLCAMNLIIMAQNDSVINYSLPLYSVFILCKMQIFPHRNHDRNSYAIDENTGIHSKTFGFIDVSSKNNQNHFQQYPTLNFHYFTQSLAMQTIVN